ncbi:hypothetical protein E2C01_028747 [Portunus trituberculatus]|uniref:Uncharacterized protein n=1 Tax=Portunus trituberculatus TaxID=210409 RepID=A0A5B7EPJ5_PORTR|nr:hypothetical protein [Portunus trituberculatus]
MAWLIIHFFNQSGRMTLDVCLFFKVSSLLEPGVAAAAAATYYDDAVIPSAGLSDITRPRWREQVKGPRHISAVYDVIVLWSPLR